MTVFHSFPARTSDAFGGDIVWNENGLLSFLVPEISWGKAAGRGAAPLISIVRQKGILPCA